MQLKFLRLIRFIAICVIIFIFTSSFSGCNDVQMDSNVQLETSAKKATTIQPVSEQEVEVLLRSYDSFEIVSHDTDLNNFTDSFTFKGQFDYKYLKTTTIGKIAFYYNSNMAEWEYSNTSGVSYEQTWDMNGTWIFKEDYSNNKHIDFKINILSLDDETCNGEIYFESNWKVASLKKFEESNIFSLSTAGKELSGRRWLDLEVSGNDGTDYRTYRIYFDKDQGILLSINNEIFYCENISASVNSDNNSTISDDEFLKELDDLADELNSIDFGN